jgi:hypothetical protein
MKTTKKKEKEIEKIAKEQPLSGRRNRLVRRVPFKAGLLLFRFAPLAREKGVYRI